MIWFIAIVISILVIVVSIAMMFLGDNTTATPRTRQLDDSYTSTKAILKHTPPSSKNIDVELLNKLIIHLELHSDKSSVVSISLPQDELNLKRYSEILKLIEHLAQLGPVIINYNTTTGSDIPSNLKSIISSLQSYIPKQRILQYSSNIGKIAILRQLCPTIHIEYDTYITAQVSPFMKVIHIGIMNESIKESQISKEKNASYICVDSISSLL